MGAGISVPGTWPPHGKLDDEGYYWLHAERSSSPAIAQWMVGCWYLIGEPGSFTPHELRRRGWELLGPVTARPHSKYLDD